MIRTGIGYDAHQLGVNYPLIIGGVKIPSKKGSIGHSDGDVLSHCIVDAMLGSLSLGDIGKYFPSSEKEWKNKKGKYYVFSIMINHFNSDLSDIKESIVDFLLYVNRNG